MANDVFGASLKEYSMIILMVGLTFTFVIVGYSFYIAISSAPEGSVLVTGQFDLGQWQGVVIGISMSGVVLVAQQLSKKDNAILMQFMKEMYNKDNPKKPDE